ncbi:MAG: hydrogenase formation protein HypD [Lentisphaeria bacterium]|nr:hydrogenase formation protein HypD [Lentisphaeria bacterium]
MQINNAREIVTSYRGRPLRIMEVCGTHTHEIFKLGIRNILPENIKLVSGPGCPVCVTEVGFIDEAVMLAKEHGVTVCTFGDLVRVPGSQSSLAQARTEGADVRIVYSPLDALALAEKEPARQVVFLSVGFETTVPGSCLAVRKAAEKNLANFSILGANKTMPQAYAALKNSADAFLFPGHVSVISGTGIYEELCKQGVSGVVCGFTAEEILTALAEIVTAFADNRTPFFKNCYPRVVSAAGNPAARALIEEVMEPCDAEWRGLNVIPGSGLRLREKYTSYDARKKFALPPVSGRGNPACRCGTVLRGDCLPSDCPLFGKVCTPLHPVGACMVSGEGACSAFYQYGGKF